MSLVLGDSEEGDDFWREQIAREAHTRFNYDIFRSCAVKSETSFEVRDPKPASLLLVAAVLLLRSADGVFGVWQESRIGGVDHSAGFLGTVADLRSSPVFRTELLAQCGLYFNENDMTFAPVPRVKHALPSLPTDRPSPPPPSIVGNSGAQSAGQFSSASSLALQALHGFVQYELFNAKSQVVRVGVIRVLRDDGDDDDGNDDTVVHISFLALDGWLCVLTLLAVAHHSCRRELQREAFGQGASTFSRVCGQ